MKNRAFIGDIHGCYEEFQELLSSLSHLSLDEIWLVGDLVDRGPDSGAVVQIAMNNKIPSVMGNHEEGIIKLYDNYKKTGILPKKSMKATTISQLNDAQVEYMRAFPRLHIFEDSNLVVVHGGLYPSLELWQQPPNVIRAQLIQPYVYGETRWWGKEAPKHKCGLTEEESFKEGYRRWYEVYDSPWNVIYGHSVFVQPYYNNNNNKNKNSGFTLGIDTGVPFGGHLTAVIMKDNVISHFVSVRSKKIYCEDKLENFIPR